MPIPKNPHAFAKQTPEQVYAFAKTLFDLQWPLSSFDVTNVAEVLVNGGVSPHMDQARAQVKFWARNRAQKATKK